MARLIRKLRKIYKGMYISLRRFNLTRVVKNDKKSHTDKWVLTKEQEASAKRFYSRYKNISLLYHNFYTEKRGEYSDEYLPDDLYYNYVDMYYNDHQEALVFDNKCLYKTLFPSANHPQTICRRQNGFWFLGDDLVIVTPDEAAKAVLAQKECFIKRATDCGGGVGVWHFDASQKTSGDFNKLVDSIQEDIIVQEPIKQHEALAKLNSSSVNTIRSVSYLGEDGVTVYANVLRIGSGGSRVDNISSGGLTCNIDDQGLLSGKAYRSSGQVITVHPDSGIAFEKYALPSFDKLQEQIKTFHLQIPQFRLVSWDFTIGEDGEPVFIEANMSSGGINIVQLSHGPLFGKDTKERLDEVFSK